MSQQLRISEIFFSLQGESRTTGFPTVFVRLTGCPLRCVYCDTEYAFKGGDWLTLDAIYQEIAKYKTPFVTVTGGEPLAQKKCQQLLSGLADRDYRVSLETSGALDIADVDERVDIVMDLKTPSSGEVEKNLWENIQALKETDQIKFVIGDEKDYEWSKTQVIKQGLGEKFEVLFSPVSDQLSATRLADWIIEDQLPVRFQIQLHKYLWGNKPGV